MTTKTGHGAARHYSWPPFEEGNTASLVHGADSERTLEAQAAQIRPRLFELCPWLEDVDAIAIAMARFLRVEARSLILESSMAEIIATAGPGKVPIRMWEQANATDRLAGDLGRKLGLDSAGRAQLRQSEASTQSSLADLAATGRAIRERRAAELAEKDEARSDNEI